MENTKICSKCGRELPLSEFNKYKRAKEGLQSYCKDCEKQYRAEHRAERIEKMKQWRADNPEYKKHWHAEHRDEQIEKMKQYNATIEGYARVIRNSNLQSDRKYGRIGANEDPLPTIEQYIELLQQPDFYDGKQYPFNEMGLDRIDNSKPHTLDNVVPATTEHNRQRHTKTFEEFKAIFALPTSRNSSLF